MHDQICPNWWDTHSENARETVAEKVSHLISTALISLIPTTPARNRTSAPSAGSSAERKPAPVLWRGLPQDHPRPPLTRRSLKPATTGAGRCESCSSSQDFGGSCVAIMCKATFSPGQAGSDTARTTSSTAGTRSRALSPTPLFAQASEPRMALAQKTPTPAQALSDRNLAAALMSVASAKWRWACSAFSPQASI